MMPYKIVDGELIPETDKNYLSLSSPKRELFDALKAQVNRAEAAEAERDEWKLTAGNQNAHLQLARKDFMRRLRVVTHLWFSARKERDELLRQLEQAHECIRKIIEAQS